ncbi:hypothetical protein LCGC14_2033880 [marine sediment metagenome]|uniref:ERCC4 domain-containing protein n=1 Tax=marine sediment metagenome TaxID=412755 RepID=A0A0F9EU38_9ZZZZ
MIPSEITVLIDSREKEGHRLLFPSWIDIHCDRIIGVDQVHIKTKVSRMVAGDYAIEGYEDVCLIETKRSLRELCSNLSPGNWPRVCKALKRLSKCQYPYLVLEMTPSELFQKSIHVENPILVFDRWVQIVVRFNLCLMIVGGSKMPGPRRKLGEQLTKLMIAHILNEGGFKNGL